MVDSNELRLESYMGKRGAEVAPCPFALGCMNFGKRTPKTEALGIVAAAIDQGIRWLDTANVYGDGESERIVGEAIRGRRHEVLLATKVGLLRAAGRVEGLSRDRVVRSCEESLRRLGVDRIDLYYLHAPDSLTPIDDTLSGIGDLLRAGKIRAWGASNFSSWQLLELILASQRASVAPPVVAQQLYNALIRQLDVEYFAFARRYGVHTTIYNPLAGGLLAWSGVDCGAPAPGKRFESNVLYQKRYLSPAMLAARERMRDVASRAGLSPLELAYAFVLGHSDVDSVIVGPATREHLEAALRARSVPFPTELRRQVDGVYRELVGTDARYAR